MFHAAQILAPATGTDRIRFNGSLIALGIVHSQRFPPSVFTHLGRPEAFADHGRCAAGSDR
jgi:hypothetical protein